MRFELDKTLIDEILFYMEDQDGDYLLDTKEVKIINNDDFDDESEFSEYDESDDESEALSDDEVNIYGDTGPIYKPARVGFQRRLPPYGKIYFSIKKSSSPP